METTTNLIGSPLEVEGAQVESTELATTPTAALTPEQRELMVKLLAEGYVPREVALMWETSIELVEALELEAHEEILNQRATRSLVQRSIDADIDEAEALALGRLKYVMAYATNPMDLVRIFTALNGAKRKTAGGGTEKEITPLVTVNLPQTLVQQVTFVTDSHKRVIQVGERPMISATNKSIDQMLLEHNQKVAIRNTTGAGGSNEFSNLTLEDLQG